MKLGTFGFLLLIILISFGYVISDDQQAHRRLDESLKEMKNLKLQIVQTDQQLNVCQETIQNNQEFISQQENKIALLNSEISGKNNEIRAMKAELSRQVSRILILEKDLMNLHGESGNLQDVQSADTGLQLNPVVLVALLTVQLVWFVAQKRQKKSYVRLSGEERALIIKLRRMKKMKTN